MNSKLKSDKKYLQRLLNFAGYPCGAVDGVVGLKTLSAISRWEQDEDDAKAICKLDERSEGNISTLVPELQKALRVWFRDKVLPWCKQQGLECKIICGTRTIAEQDALYAKGRTTAGPKVTNARGGSSLHNFAIAADLGLFKDGKYLESDVKYDALNKACGNPTGCEWGGSWKSLHDAPHY